MLSSNSGSSRRARLSHGRPTPRAHKKIYVHTRNTMQHNNGKFLNRARWTLPYKARARLRLGHTYQFSIDIAKPYAILHAGTDTHIPGVVYSCTMPIHSLANCYCFRAQTNNTLEMLRYYYLSDMMIMGNNWLVTFWSNWITMLNDRIIHLGFTIVFFFLFICLFVYLLSLFMAHTQSVRLSHV